MEKFIVTTGKTIDLAVTAALQQLGMGTRFIRPALFTRIVR